MGKCGQNPEMSGLNLEKLQGLAGKNHYWTIRASQKLRILMRREGTTSVFIQAGHHDEVYRFAEQWMFVAPVNGVPGLISTERGVLEQDGSAPTSKPANWMKGTSYSESSILEHWDTPNLLKAGFSEDEISLLRRANQNSLSDVWPYISAEKFDLVVECLEQSPEEFFQPQLITNEDIKHERFRNTIVERGALGGLSSLLTSEELRRLMSAPIEDWMVFLHPDQRDLVDRHFTGPALVRGSAGTGKTVVALHRAAAMAKRFAVQTRQPRVVLFTTFYQESATSI